MNQKHLLRFIKKQMKTKHDEVVIVKGGEELTLKQVHMYICVHINITVILVIASPPYPSQYVCLLSVVVKSTIICLDKQYVVCSFCIDTYVHIKPPPSGSSP